MVPMFIQGWEWLVILLLAVLLFGGAKLAGLGRGAGRAIREFKEETRSLNSGDDSATEPTEGTGGQATTKAAESDPDQRRDS